VASLLDVVEDQQHVGATSPNQSGTPLKFVEPNRTPAGYIRPG
jgi:hypothetical protein